MSMTIVGFVWKFIFTNGFQKLYEMTGWNFWNYSWLGDSKLVFSPLCWLVYGSHLAFTLYFILQDCRRFQRMFGGSSCGWCKFQTVIFKVTLPLLG